MPPKKRRAKAGDNQHRGRVTLPRDSHDPTTIPRATEASLTDRAKRYEQGSDHPPPTSRYTPPVKSLRFRPPWHKAVGTTTLVLGVSIAVVNDVMLLGASQTLLPGGHSELYLLLGVVVAGYSTWWFGWFDRER